MMALKKATGASLALLAISSLLAGCSGGGSQSVLPQQSKVVAPVGSIQAPAGALGSVTWTINYDRSQSSANRSAKTIPATANSVTIYAINGAAASGQPTYFPTSTCANLPATGAGTTTVVGTAPVGTDFFVIVSATGACGPASGNLPAQVLTAVAAASTAGTFTAPAGLATLPLIGTASTGTLLTQQTSGPIVVNPGVATAIPNVVLGYPLSTPQTLTGASLSTATAGITSFEMDTAAANGYALPLSINFTGPGGAVPAGSAFDTPVTIRLTDTSSAPANATLGLAIVSAGGVITSGILNTTTAAPTVNIALASAPSAGSQIVVLYNGASQDTFQSGTLSVRYNGGVVATLPITNQPQVQTIATATSGGTLPAAGVAGPLGLAMGFGTAAQGVAFIADNTGTAAGGRVVADSAIVASFNASGTATVGNSTATANTLFSGISTNPAAAGNVYVGDANCTLCTGVAGGAYGLYTLSNANAVAGGFAPTNLTVTAGVSPPFQSFVPAPYKPGVLGMVFFPFGTVGVADAGTCGVATCANGVIYFAANNSVYRAQLSTAVNVSSYVLIAGTGVPGAVGQGNVDGTGLASRLNLGTSAFVGMTSDLNLTGTAAANLYVADTGNGTVRRIGLTGTNAVSTVIAASRVQGITYDVRSKNLYVSNNDSTLALVNLAPATATAAAFAGNSGSSGNTNGLGLVAYPVQFNAGNAVSTPAGGAATTQFAGLGTLVANSNAGPQATAGVASFVAKFNNPQGISYDYGTTGYIWNVDNASPALRYSF